jgi:hypothetical protein
MLNLWNYDWWSQLSSRAPKHNQCMLRPIMDNP